MIDAHAACTLLWGILWHAEVRTHGSHRGIIRGHDSRAAAYMHAEVPNGIISGYMLWEEALEAVPADCSHRYPGPAQQGHLGEKHVSRHTPYQLSLRILCQSSVDAIAVLRLRSVQILNHKRNPPL